MNQSGKIRKDAPGINLDPFYVGVRIFRFLPRQFINQVSNIFFYRELIKLFYRIVRIGSRPGESREFLRELFFILGSFVFSKEF